MITRRHFRPTYKQAHPSMPPPLHVRGVACDWQPLARPMEAGGELGPPLIYGGAAEPSLGIDPTDPGTWHGRGYSQSAGMIGLPELNQLPGPIPASRLSAIPKGRAK